MPSFALLPNELITPPFIIVGSKFWSDKIFEKHSNFFINNGNAKTSDLEKLINKVKEEVHKKTGIKLELEIKIIGDEK